MVDIDKLCGLNATMEVWQSGRRVKVPALPDFRAIRIVDEMREQGFNDDEIEREIISDRLQKQLESELRNKQKLELKKAERRQKAKAYRDKKKAEKVQAEAAITKHNQKVIRNENTN